MQVRFRHRVRSRHCKASEILTLNLTPNRTYGVASVSLAVLIPFATPCLSGVRGATSTSPPGADALGPAARLGHGGDASHAGRAGAMVGGDRAQEEPRVNS